MVGRCLIRFGVWQDGMVELVEFLDWIGRRVGEGVPQWQHTLPAMAPRLELSDLIGKLAVSTGCPAFLLQICVWAALQLEYILTEVWANEVGTADSIGAPIKKQPSSAYQMNSRLAKYLHSLKIMSRDLGPILFMSVATDKSSVGGLPLQNSFVGMNSSEIIFPALAQVFVILWGCTPGMRAHRKMTVFG